MQRKEDSEVPQAKPTKPTIIKPIPDGIVQVEFDAGGQATFVNPNPVRPILDPDGKTLRLTWTLAQSPLHGNAGFEVFFGNVVPCFQGEYYLQDLVSTFGDFRKSWTWTWPLPQELPPSDEGILVFYDVFFCYQPTQLQGTEGGPQRSPHVQTVSLREILSTDPTVILPPKQGGGSGASGRPLRPGPR
jgi:hypothetical protein